MDLFEAIDRRYSYREGFTAAPGTQKEKLPFEQRAWFNRYGG